MKLKNAIIITVLVASVLAILTLPVGEIQFARYSVCSLSGCENGSCATRICNNGTQYGSISYLLACNGGIYDTLAGYSWRECIFNDETLKIK